MPKDRNPAEQGKKERKSNIEKERQDMKQNIGQTGQHERNEKKKTILVKTENQLIKERKAKKEIKLI